MLGLKRKFEGLKGADVPETALLRQRVRLEAHMSAHPMRVAIRMTGQSFFARKPILAGFTVLVFLSGTGGTAMAAQTSLPGESLYPIKIASEEVRARFALSDDARFQYRSEQAERRLKETEELSLWAQDASGERDRRISISMRKYEEHVEKMQGIVMKFEERDIPMDPERSLDAFSRVLGAHVRLLGYTPPIDEEMDAVVSAYGEATVGLEERFMKRMDGLGGNSEDFEMRRARMREDAGVLREHMMQAKAFRGRPPGMLEGPDRNPDVWPKAWNLRGQASEPAGH